MQVRHSQLESKLAGWESDLSLLDPAGFAHRFAIQDDLDRYFFEPVPLALDPDRDLLSRAHALSTKLDLVNERLFNSMRRQIQRGACPAEFLPIMRDLATPPRGLAYDYLDDLLAGVLQFEPRSVEPHPLEPDSVFYQPTPARHIFHLIGAAAITTADTLIDLGSGLGHVPLLASICTGATSVGIELDPTWVESASKCAGTLNLSQTTFLTQDAREADLSSGSVFYLYTPFTGATLASVLQSLRKQASLRPIRICTFGHCTLAVSDQPWLIPATSPVADQITVFLPR